MVELFFEIQLMTLQLVQTEELTDEELHQLMAPTATFLGEIGKSIAASLGWRLSSWGSRLSGLFSAAISKAGA